MRSIAWCGGCSIHPPRQVQLWATGGQRLTEVANWAKKCIKGFLGTGNRVSAVLATASPRRIKATHRRRRKVTAGRFVQRYYDPQIGRFLSTDPAVAGFNLYNYANNNPYRFTDPDGRAPVGNTCSRAGGDSCSGSYERGSGAALVAGNSKGSRPAAFATGGAVVGGVVAAVAAGGCDAATVGVCLPANPAIVGAGVAAGAVTGLAIEKAWTQLETLVQKSAVATGPSEYQYALVAARPGLYPNVRGGLSTLAAGDVWKYGTSIDPNGRYPLAGVQGLGLQMVVQTTGNHYQVLAQEKAMLIGYALTHGSLPPGNRIFK